MPFVDTGKVRLHYKEFGTGKEVLVFVHGYSGAWTRYRPVIDRLPLDRFRIIAVDLRGAGESDKPESGYGMPDFSDDIAGLARALGLPRFILAGHSMGGAVAYQFAIDHQEMLRGVMFVAPAPADGIEAPTEAMFAEQARRKADRAFSLEVERTGDAVNAGVFVRDIVRELVEQGHDVHVFTPSKGEPIVDSPAPVTTFEWGGREKVLTRLRPSNPRQFVGLARIMWSGRRALRRLASETRADAVLAMWAVPAGFWAAGSGRPFAIWALGSDIWKAGKYPFGRRLVRGVLRRADHVFANSFYLLDHARAISGRSGEFLAAGRRLPVEEPAAELAPGRRHLLFVGRWDEVKGIDVLLDAMSIVAREVPCVTLHIFGGGPLEAMIRARTATPELSANVAVHGVADSRMLVAHAKAAEFLVISSRAESVPVLYPDVLQCGCPVVSTDVGDLGRLVREQGTGIVCPPGDAGALAAAILDGLRGERTLREQCGGAVVEAAALFDPAMAAARCAAVLQP